MDSGWSAQKCPPLHCWLPAGGDYVCLVGVSPQGYSHMCCLARWRVPSRSLGKFHSDQNRSCLSHWIATVGRVGQISESRQSSVECCGLKGGAPSCHTSWGDPASCCFQPRDAWHTPSSLQMTTHWSQSKRRGESLVATLHCTMEWPCGQPPAPLDSPHLVR